MERSFLTVHKLQVLLVGLDRDGEPANMNELERLAETDNAVVVGRITQRRERPDPAYYIGRGKALEIADLINGYKNTENYIDAVIFDSDLSPAHQRNLEEIFNPNKPKSEIEGIKVIDRTELILDIFATHARTKQAKLQVELAQLEYNLPRLKHLWSHFSRLAGRVMIGRGPGEKQLEIDRRMARNRIVHFKRELRNIQDRRRQEAASRAESFTVCLIGYTNAGKSTLMNKLTNTDVLVEDKLFSTLDTKTHVWKLKSGQKILLSDTVGFIHKLPHHLVASFYATLEEVSTADLLLHLVDGSSTEAPRHIEAVHQVLKDLNCADKKIMVLLNKADRADPMDMAILQKQTGGIAISALRGTGLEVLDAELEKVISEHQREWNFRVPIGNGKAMAYLAARGKIIKQSVTNKNMRIRVRLGQRDAYKTMAMGAVNTDKTPKQAKKVKP
ncbi:MAG: GTPase HflX [Planctomycetota bacterium]